jgi:hypothetical protein
MSSNLLKSSKKITVGTSSNGYFQFFYCIARQWKRSKTLVAGLCEVAVKNLYRLPTPLNFSNLLRLILVKTNGCCEKLDRFNAGPNVLSS